VDELLDMGVGAAQPPEANATNVKALLDHSPTVTEKLEIKRQRLQDELSRTDEALTALKSNPEIERVLNLVQRASRGY
jgi:CRP-like cAMP-binding protein